MLQIFTIINLICLCICLKSNIQNANIIKILAMSIAFELSLFTIISGLYFLLDRFSFAGVTISITIVVVPLAFFCGKNALKNPALSSENDTLILFAISIIALILTINKFELFPLEQDQGAYQTEAIALYSGNYKTYHEFEEYQILQTEQDKARYIEMISTSIHGYYLLKNGTWPTISEDNISSDTSGVYHGVQTFPALLALGGLLFGIENMVQIQSVCYICACLFIFFTLQNLKIPLKTALIALVSFMFSPLVLWISKSSFTEMFLTFLISFYLLLLTETNKGISKYYIAIPLIAFSFTHVSFLVIYPIFVVINIILYLGYSEKKYLHINIISAIGLSIGYYVMSVISPQYFFSNCSRLYFAEIITADNFMAWIYGGSLCVCLFTILLHRVKQPKELYDKFVQLSKHIPVFIVGILGLILIYGFKIGFFSTPDVQSPAFLYQYYGTGFSAFTHLALFAFIMATGFLVIPCIIYTGIIDGKTLLSTPVYCSVYLLFIYCVLIQSVSIRKEVPYYYYYSRYLVFYLPIICILFAKFLLKRKQYLQNIFVLLLLSIMLIFDIPIIIQKDDSMLEWEILNDLSSVVANHSAVILESPRLQRLSGPQLKYLSGSAIFPLFENIENQLTLLSNNYSSIYYLTDSKDSVARYFDPEDFEMVYRDYYIESKNPIDSTKGLFPLSIPNAEREIVLYHYLPNTLFKNIDVMQGNVLTKKGSKESGYIQSTGEVGTVMYGPYLNMPTGHYYLKIPIEVLDSIDGNLGYCSIYVWDKKEILPKENLKQYFVETGNETYLHIPFSIDEYTEKIEFTISAEEGAVFKIYPYSIYYSTED